MEWDHPGPELMAAVFGDRADSVEAYALHLASTAVERGLVGPREVPRLWSRHLLNCAVLSPEIPSRATVADVGSGAGLPGLVLALMRPDLTVTLIEPLQRRVIWLQEVVDDLGLGSVHILRARAEALHGLREFDVVTARAVAGLGSLAQWCLPLIKNGGRFVALKGQSAPEELEAGRAEMGALGAVHPRIVSLGIGIVPEPAITVMAEVMRTGRASVSPGVPTRSQKRGPRQGSSRRGGRPVEGTIRGGSGVDGTPGAGGRDAGDSGRARSSQGRRNDPGRG